MFAGKTGGKGQGGGNYYSFAGADKVKLLFSVYLCQLSGKVKGFTAGGWNDYSFSSTDTVAGFRSGSGYCLFTCKVLGTV